MDRIREYARNPYITAGLGFLLGLIIGWFIIGWFLWPVQWYDASAAELRADLREDYLRLAIQDYNRTGDAQTALFRWQELGENSSTTLEEVTKDTTVDPEAIARFSTLVQTGAPPVVQEGTAATTEPGALPTLAPGVGAVTPAPTASGITPVTMLVVFCLITLVVGAALVYLLVLRKKPLGGGSLFSAARRAQEVNKQVDRTDYIAEGQEPPVAQFMTTYMLGDDLYDDSFSIDSQGGEFLGECGVGIAETIGVGDPKKVTAFEVWLFDKNDIQTITKVLMSEHAISDQSISQRLAQKGEPVVVEPGQRIVLETNTLVMEARVVDMNYGQGALPSGSFFERMTLELAVWTKTPQA